MRTFSFGGGVQSTAALVLAAQGRIDYRVFLFSNVGDDSENPDTLDYFRNVAMPFAKANKIELIELQKIRDGKPETLLGRIYATERSVPIPARLNNGMPGSRTCTADFKVRVVARWQKDRLTDGEIAVTGLGISIDEFHRARTDSGFVWQVLEYPLLDLRLHRRDCEKIIKDAGLPIPSKSACFFCPYHSHSAWLDLKRTKPVLFEKAVEIEKYINLKQAHNGILRLHSSMRLLSDAVGNQMTFIQDETENCESGYCFV